jgi:hypothetical protein
MAFPKKYWCCKNGHAMGLIPIAEMEVIPLFLFRQAISDPDQPELPELRGVVVLKTEVRCSICGCTRTWFPGKGQELWPQFSQERKLLCREMWKFIGYEFFGFANLSEMFCPVEEGYPVIRIPSGGE